MSSETFEVESVHRGSRLTFTGRVKTSTEPYDGYDVVVRLHGGAVEAKVRMFDHLPGRWTRLFEAMAHQWRGWEGVLSEESLEHHLHLSCKTDPTGHVRIRVCLRGDAVDSDWRAEETLDLEAGGLDALAAEARRYFGPG